MSGRLVKLVPKDDADYKVLALALRLDSGEVIFVDKGRFGKVAKDLLINEGGE